MASVYLVIWSALVPLLASLVIPILPSAKKSAGGLVFVLLNATITSVPALQALLGDELETTIYGGLVFGDILLRIDPLTAWFILVVNLTCVTGAMYGMSYLRPYEGQRKDLSFHWTLFVVFQASMIWICSLQHGLAFLVAWEIMSISSFLLVMFDHSRIKTLTAGINYLVQMHIGVACITLAFIWISMIEGSYDFNVVASFFSKPDSAWVFLLFFVGFGLKAGFIPLHTWLPHAHPAAPSHVSGVMSGVMVKIGIYGIIRMASYLNDGLVLIGELVLIISIITAFYGILSAAIHRDFKRLLAFCTIENIGTIGMAIGIWLVGKGIGKPEIMQLGLSAALLHVLNHSLYKSLLFFTTGNILQLTHTRNMEHLGGVIKTLPWTAFFFLCCSLAISGLPPFNGFVSKLLLYQSLFDSLKAGDFQLTVIVIASIATLALVGGISILTFTKSFSVIFLGSPRTNYKQHAKELLSVDHLPFFIIIGLMLGIGFFPAIIMAPIQGIISSLGPTLLIGYAFTLNSTMLTVGFASLTLLLVTGLIYLARYQVSRKKTVTSSSTWSCGYHASNTRMQYTGKSFSKTLAKLFAFIIIEEKQYGEIDRNAVFPSGRTYQTAYAEFFEKKIISKVSGRILNFMNYFSFIHNGQVQLYILYGFIFITLLIIATLLNII